MTDEYLQKFVELIAARTGLHVRDKDRASLVKTLEARMHGANMASPEIYLQLLMSARGDEWKILTPRLTNGESYFLRDKGQFSVLRTRIVPELLRRRARERTLRIWSAGCSTGEEAYSLAMLCDEIVPQGEGWNVSILGTDINEESLVRARRGAYGAWAFRGLDVQLRQKYFPDGSEVSAALRRDVSFRVLNLRGDDWPSRATGIFDMDLILCRNVLIYFRPEAIAHALAQFAATLHNGGFLLTGHAEIAGHDPAPLQVRVFPESVAYQRNDQADAKLQTVSQTKPQVITTPKGVRSNSTVLPLPSVVSKAPEKQPKATNAVAELCAAARAFADVGQYRDAIRCCREAASLDATAAGAYFVWAQVEAETGALVEAKNLFKKVIYLAPSQPDAYLELAALYEAEQDGARARKMRETALAALQALPPESTLGFTPARAEDVARVVGEMLESPQPATPQKATPKSAAPQKAAR